MALTEAEVKEIALLARLDLNNEQLAGLQEELSNMLDYVGQLQELDLDEVEPTTHAVTFMNSMRKDEPVASLDREQVLLNAPESRDGAFLIPRIVAPGTSDGQESAQEGGVL